MAKAAEEKLEWTDINVDSLKGNLAKKYKAFKVAAAAAREAREAFNEDLKKALAGKLDDGMEAVIGHNFGKLSFAQVPEGSRKKGTKSRSEAISL